MDSEEEYLIIPVTGLNPSQIDGDPISIEAKCNLGESPVWDDQRQCLYWIDISRRHFFRLSWGAQTLERWNWKVKCNQYGRPGCIALCESGRILVAFETGFAFWSIDEQTMENAGTGAAWVQDTLSEQGYDVRLNDGRVDARGRLLVGGLNFTAWGLPSWGRVHPIYVVEALIPDAGMAHTITTKILTGIPQSAVDNSLCFAWSTVGKGTTSTTLFHTDTPSGEIRAYEYDLTTATIINSSPIRSDGEVVVKGAFSPDGSVTDNEGGLWNAHCDQGRIVRYVPGVPAVTAAQPTVVAGATADTHSSNSMSGGKRIEDNTRKENDKIDNNGGVLYKEEYSIKLPTAQATCPIIGGTNHDLLIVTTGRPISEEIRRREPLAGSLFIYKLPRSYDIVQHLFKDVNIK